MAKSHQKPSQWLLFIALIFGAFGLNFFFQSCDQSHNANHLSMSLSEIQPGAELHTQATIQPAPTIYSPITLTACVAAQLDLYYVTRYEDDDNDTHYDEHLITTLRFGPDHINLLASASILTFPLSLGA